MEKLNNEDEKAKFSHFSHEHPLELTNLSQTTNKTCSGCNIDIVPGKNFYTCKTCNFFLHQICFNLPRTFKHLADPAHELNLLFSQSFECKACGHHGSGFSYSCSICLHHYHILCTLMPLTKTSLAHPHALKLIFSPPYENHKAFCCDICKNPGFDHWLYHCSGCEFDGHLTCVNATPPANANSIITTDSSTRAPPSNTSTTYVNHDPLIHTGGNSVYQTVGYAQPGGNITQGFGYANPPGRPGGGQGAVGAGVAGVVVTSVLTGIGEGMGQDFAQGVFDMLGS